MTNSQLIRTIAAVVASAIAAPTASARPIDDAGHPIDDNLVPAGLSVSRTVDAGFDWDSFAIGAGSASALIMVAVGAGSLRRRHAVPA
jgi:hypothetical protein